MVKRIKFNNDYIFIDKKDDFYIPYVDRDYYKLGIASSGILRLVNQKDLKRAYETGELKTIISKGE